jgi:UDP-2,3-diacylglucosamine pyrophosphatase LpxH
VSALLGVQAPTGSFPHVLKFEDPPVIIRHGHEYDPFNFSADHTKGSVPLNIPEAEYDAPTFGDFMTVQVASQLPVLFRARYKDSAILSTNSLRELYLRLIQFDDVRPQSALLEFLLATPGTGLNEDGLWDLLNPVVKDLLNNVQSQPFLSSSLGTLSDQVGTFGVALVKLLLGLKVWKVGLPLWLIRTISSKAQKAGGASGNTLIATVQKEAALGGEDVRAAIAGHTHEPRVVLLSSHGEVQQYYIDTGTWRTRIPATTDEKEFGRLKALTYVITYGSNEDPSKLAAAPGAVKIWSFDYWSGFTQRWPA